MSLYQALGVWLLATWLIVWVTDLNDKRHGKDKRKRR